MNSLAWVHAELTCFLRQHCPACDQRLRALQDWMVAGLLLSQSVCFNPCKSVMPLGHYLPTSCQRLLRNARIDVEALYGPLLLWALQQG